MTYKDCEEGCIGCIEFEPYTCVSSKIVDGITVTCPCQTCLIKMICAKPCKEFSEYTDLWIENKELSNDK